MLTGNICSHAYSYKEKGRRTPKRRMKQFAGVEFLTTGKSLLVNIDVTLEAFYDIGLSTAAPSSLIETYEGSGCISTVVPFYRGSCIMENEKLLSNTTIYMGTISAQYALLGKCLVL